VQISMISSEAYKWHAVYTKSRNEKQVAQLIQKKGIDAYLPLQKKLKVWSDRKKWVEEPLIRSYVFVRVCEREYYEVLNIQGVVKYVTFNSKAAPIPDWQIDAMKKVVASDLPVSFSTDFFKKDEQIKIESGPLMGFKGTVVMDSHMKKKVAIHIHSIGLSMLVQIDPSFLKRARSNKAKKA
jgi:transcriptional antiterminator RfaH